MEIKSRGAIGSGSKFGGFFLTGAFISAAGSVLISFLNSFTNQFDIFLS